MRKKICLGFDGLLDDLNLGSNILLQLHGVGDAVLRGHLVRLVLDVVELAVGVLHPVVDCLDGLVIYCQNCPRGPGFFPIVSDITLEAGFLTRLTLSYKYMR